MNKMIIKNAMYVIVAVIIIYVLFQYQQTEHMADIPNIPNIPIGSLGGQCNTTTICTSTGARNMCMRSQRIPVCTSGTCDSNTVIWNNKTNKDEAVGKCVECTSDSNCTTTGKPKCNLSTNKCTECNAYADCKDRILNTCSSSGKCVGCNSHNDCGYGFNCVNSMCVKTPVSGLLI